MKILILAFFFASGACCASETFAPTELVPFKANFASDNPRDLPGIPIHSKDACVGLLLPILEPEAIINAGIKALSTQGSANRSCLSTVLGAWEQNSPPAPDPFPNPIWETKEKLNFWSTRAAYFRKAIRCYNPEKPGSDEFEAFASMQSSICDGFWINKEEYLEKKTAFEAAVKQRGRFAAEGELRERFPNELPAQLTKNELEQSQFATILQNPTSSLLYDREALFAAFTRAHCAKLAKPYAEPNAAQAGMIAFCEEKQFKTDTDPAPFLARYREIVPNISALLARWKENPQAHYRLVDRKRKGRSDQLTFDYGLRRLLAAYAFANKGLPAPLALENFCAANEARLRADIPAANVLEGVDQFKTPEQWRLAEEYGLSELELTGIAEYTGHYFRQINYSIWGAGDPLGEKLSKEGEVIKAALAKGIDRLPSYKEGPVKRFSELPASVLAQHQVGKIVTYAAYTSTSRREDWAWGDGKSHGFLIYGAKNGKVVTALSRNSFEDEVLFKAGTRFKVLSRKPKANGLFDFVLAEVDEAGNVIGDLSGMGTEPGK